MLSDIKVIDLTTFLSGPYCTMILSDMGADVVKIESPGKGCPSRQNPPFIKGQSAYFMSLNRGKKGMTLNLKTERGKEIFLRLAAEADVLVENFRPGVMERLGLDYGRLAGLNPRLVYAALSGFGSTGPFREKGAYDMVIQGYGGIMSITGTPGGEPVRTGYSIADISAGVFGAIAVLGALRVREKLNRGQFLDVSMLDCQVALMENAVARYFATGEIPGPHGNRHPSIAPFQAFMSSNGYFTVTASTDEQFRNLCDAVGLPGLTGDSSLAHKRSRVEHVEKINAIFGPIFAEKPKEYWIELLERYNVPCAPVNNVQEMVESPPVRARDMIIEMEHRQAGKIRTAGTPIKASLTPLSPQYPAPLLGEHNAEILFGMGYGLEEIQAFRDAGVI